ncbi:hypothetical protein PSTG_16002 [Puccinia striiformis f. sp. tritici PST-78]|uniref:SAM domain-containing protein n=1 Tax=Puccinia striiformis f. sp. tritici PST-78 TaxID=1165861 RepID=A0A0L0UU40_9BASI|nr:hypothetical protein PSTG_16002 [Puccinia striiformis f. sp. tritici PST-78]
MSSQDSMVSANLPPYMSSIFKSATDQSVQKIVKNPPIFPSTEFQVLVPGPPAMFKCAIAFVLYCSEKSRKNTLNWIPVRSHADLGVTLTYGEKLTWEGFQLLIGTECDKSHNYIGRLIQEGSASFPATIAWSGYILGHKTFPKSSPHHLFDEISFKQWIDAINASPKQNKGGIIIRMDDPRTTIKHARQENLLAKTMKRIDARTLAPSGTKSMKAQGDSEHEDSSDVEFDDLDVHVDNIYKKYGMNSEYDRVHPVYPDPTDPDQYILLTAGNVDVWAKALSLRVAGVSITAPPSSIKFLLRSKAAKAKAPVADQGLAAIAQWLTTHQNGHKRSSPPSSVYGGTAENLIDYLDFISIAPHKREGILNTLLHNDIDDYQMFKSLSIEELKALGFNVGVISKLRTNVGKYRNHLNKTA